jgi:hypothetical protein
MAKLDDDLGTAEHSNLKGNKRTSKRRKVVITL